MRKKVKQTNRGFSRITSRKNLGGFTITELMIVLVVGGLILTIVFLAVPALQRNSRNSQYKNEAASILDATQQFVTNNRGAVPKCDSALYAACFTSPPPYGLSSADLDKIKGLANLKNITWIVIPSAAGTAANDLSPNLTTVVLQRGVKCGSNVGGDKYSVTTASSRSIVVVYALENANGTVNAQCMEME